MFIMLGIGYAFPLPLYHTAEYSEAQKVPMMLLNLNLLTSWLGLSHFYFAYEGQFLKARSKTKKSFYFIYFVIAVFVLLALVLAYKLMPFQIFFLLVWVSFIPHFIKAESMFMGFDKRNNRLIYPFPTLAFAFFSLSLYINNFFVVSQWVIFLIGVTLAFFGFLWIHKSKNMRWEGPFFVISAFFIAEGLLWGTYSKYMDEDFQYGVYAFHISAFSFYHYFRSYQFGFNSKNFPLTLKKVILINSAMMLLGYLALYFYSKSPIVYLFGYEYFTIYVALHLILSEIFPRLQKRMILTSP